MRNLDKNPGAVTRFGITAARATMCQVNQDLDALEDNVVRFVALDVGHKTNPAGVMFQAGMIKALRFGEAIIYTRVAHRFLLDWVSVAISAVLGNRNFSWFQD